MPLSLRLGQQMEQRGVFVVTGHSSRDEADIHIALVGNLKDLGRQLVVGEEPAAELGPLPERVRFATANPSSLPRTRPGTGRVI